MFIINLAFKQLCSVFDLEISIIIKEICSVLIRLAPRVTQPRKSCWKYLQTRLLLKQRCWFTWGNVNQKSGLVEFQLLVSLT